MKGPNIYHLLIVFIAIIYSARAIDQMANYPLITYIKSGDHKLLTATTTGNTTITLSYFQFFSTAFPTATVVSNIRVAIAIRDMQIANTSKSGNIDYTCQIHSNITKTNFYTNLTINPNGNTFSLLYYMYIGVDIANVPNSYLIYKQLALTGQFDDTVGKTYLANIDLTPNSVNIVDPNNAVVAPYVMSFGMNAST